MSASNFSHFAALLKGLQVRNEDVGDLHVCNSLLLLHTVKEGPDRGVVTVHQGSESVVSSFSDVTGSWEQHLGGFVVVPRVVVVERRGS